MKKIAAAIIAASIIFSPSSNNLKILTQKPMVEYIRKNNEIVATKESKNGIYLISRKELRFKLQQPIITNEAKEEIGNTKITIKEFENGWSITFEETNCLYFIDGKFEEGNAKIILKNEEGKLCILTAKLDEKIENVKAMLTTLRTNNYQK